MNNIKLLLVLSICFSAYYTAFAQTNFDRLISTLDAVKADPAGNDQAIVIKNIESLNTEYLDYSPVLHKKGLVFSSNRPKRNNFLGKFFSTLNSNIYYTAEEGEHFFFSPIELPGKINNSRHQGAISFYNNNNAMIYTTNCSKRNKEGLYDLKLCASTFINGEWQHTKDLHFSKAYRACHPAVSEDGSVLIFAGERPDGFGGMDLYLSLYENGVWQKPKNLGPEINTLHDEVFPNLTEEGILVFSSSGHNGCGGLDLFYAKPVEAFTWANPVSFGHPFNSKKDDFGFMTMEGGQKGCFSSSRLGGKGGDDLYLWQMNEAITETDLLTANILILDEATGIPLQESDITLIEINSNLLQTGVLEEEIIIANTITAAALEMIGNKVISDGTTEKGHKYEINADHNYFLMIAQEGYDNVQRMVSVQHLVEYDEYAIVMNSTGDEQLEGLVFEDPKETIETVATPKVEKEELVVASMILDEPISTRNMSVEAKAEAKISTPTTDLTEEPEAFTSRGIPTGLIKEEAPVSESVIAESVTAESAIAESVIAESAIVETSNNKSVTNYSVRTIYYAFNKFNLTAQSKRAIDEIILLLKSDRNTVLTINSHTDSRGARSFNKSLSQKRADAVKMYMLSQGIEPERINAYGIGESFLLNNCADGVKCDENSHKANRRTEFIFNQQKRSIKN